MTYINIEAIQLSGSIDRDNRHLLARYGQDMAALKDDGCVRRHGRDDFEGRKQNEKMGRFASVRNTDTLKNVSDDGTDTKTSTIIKPRKQTYNNFGVTVVVLMMASIDAALLL